MTRKHPMMVVTATDYSLVVLQLKKKNKTKNYSIESTNAVKNCPDNHATPLLSSDYSVTTFIFWQNDQKKGTLSLNASKGVEPLLLPEYFFSSH